MTDLINLSEAQVDQLHRIDQTGIGLQNLVDEISKSPDTDKRWLAMAKNELQFGFMALQRAVIKPQGFA